MNMYVGRIDTTFASLEWAMAELINHPDEMPRLQEEIRAAVRDDDHIIEDHLNKLHYLKLVIKETLRLHPPVPLVPRETVEDAELLGYHVPARTRILVNVWAIGREPTTWERAEEFLPERFAEDVDMDQYMLGQDFTLLPFGAGRRGCPGAGFAMASVELVLANLLYHFNWSLPGGASMVNMDEQGGLAVRLKKTLHLVAMPWCSKTTHACSGQRPQQNSGPSLGPQRAGVPQDVLRLRCWLHSIFS
ncbi:cytochrome P450 71A1-like [Panicum miliaceum]|uniref:Cytochrome P450 71A1-like n=1 Tax=Panicum miliaceum TaxID=4540 RepID=A0A3L6R3D3_PANMI|nr:cytochrome P450 71A1-like [Panicum miliaceum]